MRPVWQFRGCRTHYRYSFEVSVLFTITTVRIEGIEPSIYSLATSRNTTIPYPQTTLRCVGLSRRNDLRRIVVPQRSSQSCSDLINRSWVICRPQRNSTLLFLSREGHIERKPGLEPESSAWKAEALPLCNVLKIDRAITTTSISLSISWLT